MSNDTKNIVIAGIEFADYDGKQYETTGEYRPPKKGEWRLSGYIPSQSTHDWETPEIILRELLPPAPPRRVPTDADAIHRPKCWVKYNGDDNWLDEPETLIAVVPESGRPFKTVNARGSVDGYMFCEIEDVPLGPVYHWRDATEADVDTTPEGIQWNNGTNGFGLTVRSIPPETRVLVEVGK